MLGKYMLASMGVANWSSAYKELVCGMEKAEMFSH